MDIENSEEWTVLVGRVASTWDRAFLKVQSFSENQQRFDAGGQLRVGPLKKLLEIKSSRKSGHAFILDCGLTSTEEALALVAQELYVHPSMRPPLPQGEFYVDAVLGLKVITEAGDAWGEIIEVLDSPAHDIYVTREAMIPAVDAFVVKRDFENGSVVVRDIPGLRFDSIN